jgi:hypothetical protein
MLFYKPLFAMRNYVMLFGALFFSAMNLCAQKKTGD